MKCLTEGCENQIENKTGRRKFCSNACKMKHFRKHGKKNELKPFQMQALYAAIMDKLSDEPKIRLVTPISQKEILADYNATHPNQQTVFENKPLPPKITRSAEQWHELKRACESADEWAKVKEQIENAENLSSKQKQTIINTP